MVADEPITPLDLGSSATDDQGSPVEVGGEEAVSGRAPLSRRRLLLGTALFLAFTAAGVLAVVWLSDPDYAPVGKPWASARFWPLVAAALLGLAELPLGGTRLWVAGRHFDPGFRWRDGFTAHLYNAFIGGLTPMRTGGGPAQYYVLQRSGLEGGQAVSVLTISWVGRMFGFVMYGAAALLFLVRREVIAPGGAAGALVVTALALTLVALAMVFAPGPFTFFLARRRRVRRSRFGRRLLRALARYRRAVESFVQEGRRRWLANAVCSWLILPAQCAAGVAVLVALGIPADHLSALARQALQFSLIYVSPTPAGSGVAEFATLGFMAGLVPLGAMAAFTILWRAATGYLPIAAGGLGIGVDLAIRTWKGGRGEAR